MIDALILAGSKNDGPLKECSPVPYEAMITIGRKSMIDYVIDALRGSGRISRIVVVGPVDIAGFCDSEDVTLVPAEGSLMENIKRGVGTIPVAKRILLVTCDIPLINPQAIEDFLESCGDMSSDIYYPVIPRDIVENSFLRTKRTYVSFKEGDFTGGNMFLINPGAVERCMQNGQRLIDARKSPIRLSRLLGLIFLLKFVAHKISIKEAQEKASVLLGVEGSVVVTRHPEIGVDVDKPSDLEIVRKLMNTA